MSSGCCVQDDNDRCDSDFVAENPKTLGGDDQVTVAARRNAGNRIDAFAASSTRDDDAQGACGTSFSSSRNTVAFGMTMD